MPATLITKEYSSLVCSSDLMYKSNNIANRPRNIWGQKGGAINKEGRS